MSRLACKIMRIGAALALVSGLVLPLSAGAFARPDPVSIVGQGVQALKAGWGRPDSKEVKSDGGEVWIYSRTFTGPPVAGPSYSRLQSPTMDNRPAAFTSSNSSKDDSESKTCETRFEVSPDKQVVTTQTTGSGCAIGPARA